MKKFTGPILFVLTIILDAASVTLSQKIHEEMSVEERAEIFLTADDNIPEYDIVSIHLPRVHTRNVERAFPVRFKAFEENIELWLRPIDGVLAGANTPIYAAMKTPYGNIIKKFENNLTDIFNQELMMNPATMTDYQKARRLVEELYEDSSSHSTLVLSNSPNGQRTIRGIIGSKNLAIRPIPERLVEKITKRRRSLDGIDESEYDHHHYYIVSKIDATNLINPLKNPSRSNKLKRNVPDVIYPEILVIVDYDFASLFQHNVYTIIPYLLAFWNGVDMNYRNLKNPKYRLNIAGIVIAKDRDALEYMAAHRYNESKLYSYAAISDFGKWLFKHDQYISVESYDIAVTITTNRLCGRSDRPCDKQILGQAFPSGACSMNKKDKMMYKTSIVHDDADYNAILTATHELGHLFGANHDESEDDNTLCRSEDGYIMVAVYQEDHTSDWSDCSLSNFTEFLNNDGGKCLYNKPDQDNSVPRLLPGQVIDANKQCQKYHGTDIYKIDETICRSLPCLYEGKYTEYEDTGFPALDGTPCGRGKMCFHQQCISMRNLHN